MSTIKSSGENLKLSSDNTKDIELQHNGSTKVTVKSDGNVGIGTSSPSHKLSVEGSSGSRTILNADGVGTTVNINTRIRPNGQGGVEVGSTSSDAYLHSLVDGGSMVLSTRHGSTDTERMRIDASGNVGIGVTPTAKLQVSGATILGTPATFYVGDDGGSLGAFLNETANAPMRFHTSGSERMRIDSAGRVTMPYQPMCWLDGNSSGVNYSAGDTLKAFTASVNGGMTWNSSNGRVTVPVNGWYQWNVFIYGYHSGHTRIQMYHNGVRRALGHDNVYNTQDNTISFSIVLPMSANDYVHLNTDYSGNIYMGTGHSVFSGHLIG